MENIIPNDNNGYFCDEEDIQQKKMQQNTKITTTSTTGYLKNDIQEDKEEVGDDGDSDSSNVLTSQRYFIDHYSIKSRSSSIHCRDSIIHIYDQRNKQLVIEDKTLPQPLRRRRWPASSSDGSDDTTTSTSPLSSQDDDESSSGSPSSQITVKYIKNGSSGLNVLRIIYTLIAFLVSGFLFIFCLEILLLLFTDLLLSIGPTSSVPDDDDGPHFYFGIFMGTFFSVPLYVYAMSSAMAIASRLIADAWSGHVDLRGVQAAGIWNGVPLVEWSGVVVMLGVPCVVMSVYLMFGSDSWWEIGGLTWIFCLLGFFLSYACSVIYFEFSACVKLFGMMREMDGNGGDEEIGCGWCGFLKRVLYLHQLHNYAGSKSISFFVDGSCPLTKEAMRNRGDLISSMTDNLDHDGREHIAEGESMGLYSRFTTWEPMSIFFTKLDPPVRIRELSPSVPHNQMTFVTKNNWSLGNLVINPAMTSFIVVKGPDAITLPQVRSSFAFLLLTIIVLVLMVFTLLVWCGLNFGVSFGISIVVALCWTPRVKISLEALRIYEAAIAAAAAASHRSRATTDDSSMEKENYQNQVIYRVTHTFRVTIPSNALCWFLLLCEVTFFFIWPLTTLYFVGDMSIFVFFIVLGIVTGARLYFNPMTLLAEFGSRSSCNPINSSIQGDDHQRHFDSNLNWKDQVRLNLIIDKVSQTRNRHLWQSIFLSVALVIIVVFISAFTTSEEEAYQGKAQNLTTYIPDFYYDQKPDLEYPTCRMKRVSNDSDISVISDSVSTTLLDYAFLSLLAYYSAEDTQYHLDQWFGDGVAVNEQQIVDDFKASLSDGAGRPVVYKLIAFPQKKLRIVTIRGTTDSWELLADLQLWTGSALAKCLRGLVPMGDLWNPIIPTVLQMTSFVGNLGKISFYKETTKFVHHLRLNPTYEGTNYTSLHVTGHSLGGGLAIISGTQTDVPTVAISAPNAMLSRKTFDPPLSEERLDRNAFNVIPNNDVISRFDDPGRLFQNIQCRATFATPFYCHDLRRSTCEIMFKCGTTSGGGYDAISSNGGGQRRRGYHRHPAFCECATRFGYPEPIPSGNRTFAEACASIDVV